MANVYRGYPQVLHMMEQNGEPKPYMIYRREEKKPVSEEDERRRKQADREYFRGLCPQSMKRCRRLVEEGCDQYDRPGSPIYDDYPDREMIYGMRDGILRRAGELGLTEDRDIVQLLLLHEIQRRRERR